MAREKPACAAEECDSLIVVGVELAKPSLERVRLSQKAVTTPISFVKISKVYRRNLEGERTNLEVRGACNSEMAVAASKSFQAPAQRSSGRMQHMG